MKLSTTWLSLALVAVTAATSDLTSHLAEDVSLEGGMSLRARDGLSELTSFHADIDLGTFIYLLRSSAIQGSP